MGGGGGGDVNEAYVIKEQEITKGKEMQKEGEKKVGQRHKRQKIKKQSIDKEVILIVSISFLDVTKVTKNTR